MNTLIRKATQDDVDSMVNLLEQLFSIEADFIPDMGKQKKGLLLMIDNPAACVLVAETDGNISGMLTAQFVISTAEGKTVAWLEDMVVDKRFRGMGIGSQIMSQMEKQLYQLGISRMQLLADKMNSHALLFYKKQEWNETQLICLRKYVTE
jgi:ribosomal protein S18 acetylase RimI-like enzyme